jgi:DNA-binding response OmpR family regulator
MGAKKTTILAVDDEPRLLKFVAYNLELEGYAVLTTTDGQQALDLIKEHKPDLVLLDLMMPQMDGFSVCQAIRQFSAIPIIIVTARGQDQDKIRGFDLGADDYLTKPFSVEELIVRIRAVLRRAQVTTNDYAYTLQTTMTIGPLSIDDARHQVKMADQEIALSPSSTVSCSTWRKMLDGWCHRNSYWNRCGARTMLVKGICCASP